MVVVSFTDNRQIGERSSYSVLECTYQEQGKATFSVVLVKILLWQSHPYLFSSSKAAPNNRRLVSKKLSFASIAALFKSLTGESHFQLSSFICSACQM